MARKKTPAPKSVELSRRSAAALARATAGRAKVVSPNKKAYDRRKGKAVPG